MSKDTKLRNERRWWERGQVAVMDADCYGGRGCLVEVGRIGGEGEDGSILYYVTELVSRQHYPVNERHLKRREKGPTPSGGPP